MSLIELFAGPVSVLFDTADAGLRYLKVQGHEAVRGVYAAVRDSDWDTVPARVSDLDVQQHADSFTVSFRCRHRTADIDFSWLGTITGTPDGTVTFDFDGTAASDFLRNRIGFCILHPLECAGLDCRVGLVDGGTVESAFPGPISPHQPFMNVRSVTHSPAAGLEVTVLMEGAVFEMEDQRNWTDASFKTYCTPLAEPFPVPVSTGDTVRQRITITPQGSATTGAAASDGPLQVLLTDEPLALLPRLGLGLPSHGEEHDARQVELLRELNPAHLRLDLRPAAADRDRQLARALQAARALDSQLEIAVQLSTGQEREQLEWLAAALGSERPARWFIHHEASKTTTEAWLRLARELLGDAAPCFAGTLHFFAELNRERPPVGAAAGVVFSINPQVHAFDDISITETLSAQRVAVANAAALAAGKPVAVSPLTLRMRLNPNATGPAKAESPDELPGRVDPRQREPFAAAWTIGSIRQLALAGTHSATWFETTGWLGVMERAGGSPLPDVFPSAAGEVFPVWHALADLAACGRQATVLNTILEAQPNVDVLTLRAPWGRRSLLVNHTPRPVQLQLHGLSGPARLRELDSASLERARLEPQAFRADWREVAPVSGSLKLTLGAHALVTLDEPKNGRNASGSHN